MSNSNDPRGNPNMQKGDKNQRPDQASQQTGGQHSDKPGQGQHGGSQQGGQHGGSGQQQADRGKSGSQQSGSQQSGTGHDDKAKRNDDHGGGRS